MFLVENSLLNSTMGVENSQSLFCSQKLELNVVLKLSGLQNILIYLPKV